MGPCLVKGIEWVYRDSRLGAHTKGPGTLAWTLNTHEAGTFVFL